MGWKKVSEFPIPVTPVIFSCFGLSDILTQSSYVWSFSVFLMILIPPMIFLHWKGSRTKTTISHTHMQRRRKRRDISGNENVCVESIQTAEQWRLLSPGSYVGAAEARWLRCETWRRTLYSQDTCAKCVGSSLQVCMNMFSVHIGEHVLRKCMRDKITYTTPTTPKQQSRILILMIMMMLFMITCNSRIHTYFEELMQAPLN